MQGPGVKMAKRVDLKDTGRSAPQGLKPFFGVSFRHG
jgi:hypothetical protein